MQFLFPNLELYYKYPNGGVWYAKTNWLVEMATRYPNTEKMNDQHWLQTVFLKSFNEGINVQLDNHANIFQNIMHDHADAFVIEGQRVYNRITKSYPVFVHGNGKTKMDKYYSIL
jgi:hypothetical protein